MKSAENLTWECERKDAKTQRKAAKIGSLKSFLRIFLCVFASLRSVILFSIALLPAHLALANPTQEEVFRSLDQNMHEVPKYTLVLPWLFGAAGVVGVVMYFRQRQKIEANPKALNNPAKLLREVADLAQIGPDELKRLKTLAEQRKCASPLTLLLCPSLLADSQPAEPAPKDHPEAA